MINRMLRAWVVSLALAGGIPSAPAYNACVLAAASLTEALEEVAVTPKSAGLDGSLNLATSNTLAGPKLEKPTPIIGVDSD